MNLASEQNELMTYWKALFSNGRDPFDPNLYGSTHLKRLLREESEPMDVRKFHDKLGWCAGYGKFCRGSIYRTSEFMNTSDRCGSNPHKKKADTQRQNIHIEHTVQITFFHKNFWRERPKSASAAISYLMQYSPTTAMTMNEKAAVGKAAPRGFGHVHPDPHKPFIRYASIPGIEVWNILKGEKVDLESYTSNMHLKTISDLLDRIGSPSAAKLFSMPQPLRSNRLSIKND